MAVTLKAVQRKDLQTATTKQLRKEGHVPGVVYGKGEAASNIAVNSLELQKTVRDEGRNAIITLDVDGGESVDVMLHDYQTDSLRGDLLHVDFYIVDMSAELDVEVSVNIVGEAIGVKEGGVLQQTLHEILITAKPADIPESIDVDVAELNIGDSIAVGDLPKASTYTFAEDESAPVVTVVPPDTLKSDSADEEESSAEPEVIGEKAKDEE